jgi:hypothetical protein
MQPGERPPPGARLSDETGQTFVFVLTILFALLLLAATSVNIGQAVSRRILLQMLADAGAFTGATEMSRGMNTIAEQNGRIQEAWATLARATRYFGVPPCGASDQATGAYGRAQGELGRVIEAVNQGYGSRAAEEARAVTEFSARDLFPGESLEMGESLPPLGPQRPAGRVVDLEQVPDGTVSERSGGVPGRHWAVWSCYTVKPKKAIWPRQGSFGLWYRAVQSSMPTSFVWVVSAPARQARLFDRFFGPWAIPAMSAASVAKPIRGEIKEARARYVAKMVPLRELLRGVDDNVRRRWREIYH